MPYQEFIELTKLERAILNRLTVSDAYISVVARSVRHNYNAIRAILCTLETRGWVSSTKVLPPHSINPEKPLRIFKITDMGKRILIRWEDYLMFTGEF